MRAKQLYTMPLTPIQQQIEKKYQEIHALRKQQAEISKAEGLKKIADYIFKDIDGKEISIETLFGSHDELIIIHNMGKSCKYCTLWADGLSSSYKHISSRCAFALVSPDSYEVMKEFASNRDWKYPYYSGHETDFIYDMGFESRDGDKKSFMPGYTTFLKKEDGIYRVACDTFGPGDFYSPVWQFMDMLHHGQKEWIPSY